MSDSSNVYQYTEDKNIVKFELPPRSGDVVISPYGRLVFSSDSGKNAYVLNAESGNLVTTLDWNKGQIMDAAFSPDNAHVAACSFNSFFMVWGAKRGDMICSFKYTQLGHSRKLAWSPNGTNLACAFGEGICVVDIYKKALIAVLSQRSFPKSSLYAVAWSFDGNRIMSGSNYTVCVWNLEKVFKNSSTLDGPEKNFLKATEHEYYMIYTPHWFPLSVAFSPDGLLIACGTMMGKVCLVKPSGTYMEFPNEDRIAMPNGHTNDRYEHNRITSLSFSPDSKSIVSAAKDMSICVWDVDTRTCVKIINIPEIQITKLSFCIFENVDNRFGESDSREIIMVASKFNRRDNKGLLYGNNHSTCVIRKWTQVDEKYNLLKLASEAKINPNPEEDDLNKFIQLYKKKSDGITLTPDEKILYNILVKKELILLYLLSEKKTKIDADKKYLSPVEQRMYDSLSKKYNFQVIMNSQLLQRNTLEYLKGEEPDYKEKNLDFKELNPTMGYFPEEDNPAAPVVGDTGCFGAMCKTRKGGRKGLRKTRVRRKNNTNKLTHYNKKNNKNKYKRNRMKSFRNKK
jgi:hypothetical protein